MKKKPIEMIKNKYTPLIKMEDELSTLVQFQEKIMAEVIDRQDEEYANFLISQITLFMKENNVSICFILNKEELIDCLKEHNKLHYEILNLQSQLDQANERLKGAIELPVKLGDTIYVVPSRTNYQINIINNKEEKNKVSEFVVSEIRYNKYGYSVVCYIDYIPFYFNYETAKGYCEHFDTEQFYGETWFATLKEAKKKLQELRGGEWEK